MDFSVKAAAVTTEYNNANNVNNNSSNSNNNIVGSSTDGNAGVPTNKTNTQKAAAEQATTTQTSDGNGKTDTNKNPLVDKDEIAKAILEANRNCMFAERSFAYRIEDSTKRVIITVIDSKTQEVIKEIPPEKQVDAVRKMWELAGLIVDKKI